MVAASLYIIVCSARNRTRQRLRRLREPRYVVGAAVGAAYLYVSIFGRVFGPLNGGRRRRDAARARTLALSAVQSSAPAVLGVGLLALAAVSWAMPFNSGLLEFSDAETAFLFPAPVSRRALLMHRLMRSQIGLLFGAVVMGLAIPSTGGFMRLRIGIAVWLLLCTSKIAFTGITLVRARLAGAGGPDRRIAVLPIAATAGAVAIVGAALAREFARAPIAGMAEAMARVSRVASSGLSAVVLWPFVAVARPLLAEWPRAYLLSLVWAAVVLAAVVAWVLKSDEAFEDAVSIGATRRAESAARVSAFRVRGSGLPLALEGRPELALAWKAALQTLRIVNRQVLVRAVALLFVLSGAAVSISRARGLAVLLGLFTTVGAGAAVLLAPQMLRVDMRQDLAHLDLLKTWPVRSASIVRGEMLWPGVLATGAAWVCVGLAFVLSGALFATTSLDLRAAVAMSAVVAAPAFVFAQFTIQNAAALMFPAWIPLGTQRTRGIDAMGQRLIMLGGTWLVLVAMALPGIVAGGITWFAFRHVVGVGALVPAAVVCAAIIGTEVLLATEALGPVYDRIDVTSAERAE
jgi:hypothetical protein